MKHHLILPSNLRATRPKILWVTDLPHGVTGSTVRGTPTSSSVSQAREDSRIWIESCVWSWLQQSRESPVHPLATSREESPLFRLSVIFLVRNTNRKSLNSRFFQFFYSLWLHSTARPPQQLVTASGRGHRKVSLFLSLFFETCHANSVPNFFLISWVPLISSFICGWVCFQ